MIKVYVTGYWEDDLSLFNTIKKYAFGSTTWKNLEFTTEPNFDRVVVLNYWNAGSHAFLPEEAIYFRLEPPDSPNYLHQASGYILPGYLHWPLWHKFSPAQLAIVQRLGQIKKRKLFSTVTSDLAYMHGHVQRLEMIYYLDQCITEGFDIWGRNSGSHFFNNINGYRGELDDKYDGLLDYSYHLSVENTFTIDYFTEKISDPILAECMCFYAGCNNIEEYIDPRSFCKIDLTDKDQAKETIIKSIQDNQRKMNLKYIKQQKKRLLTDLNPLNLIWLAVNEADYIKKIKL